MAGLHYDEAAAARLEAVYLGEDVVAQRKDTLRRLDLKPGEAVLDIGSGPGFLASAMAEQVGPTGRVRGVDVAEAMVRRAESRNAHDWLSYAPGDAAALPEPDMSYDAVVSVQVAEYVPNIPAFCREFRRVMRTGGRGIVLATDWDTVAWHSIESARMARVLGAFRSHCAHPHLPRTLAPALRAAGLRLEAADVYSILNLDRAPGSYSEQIVPLIKAYVAAGGAVPPAELNAWEEELAERQARNDHFFCIHRFVFEVSRPA